MALKMLVVYTICCLLVISEASDGHLEEARGKKKKIALLIYFADIVLKKIFIFKLIYAFVFWVVIHKAGYFLSWFIGYLKEQKQKHHEHHEHYTPHHHYEYGSPQEYGPPHEYGPTREYGPPQDPYRW